MAHEILSVKLYELDKAMSRVHSRIQMSECATHEQIKAQIEELRKECIENGLTLRNKLKLSKAGSVAKLSEAYGEIEHAVEKVKKRIGQPELSRWDEELSVEEKILFAEYALDFAVQAANNALLISMEALDAQMEQEEKRESVL